MTETLEGTKNRRYIYDTKKIGRGAFSKVYKGYQENSVIEVAIKKVEKEFIKENLMKRLRSEIALMYTLEHENIVKLYDNVEDTEYCYLVLEYCEGGDLYHLLSKKRLSENRCKEYTKQLIKGLKYLRDKNIVHRDLKPHNILLSKDYNTLKLADFNFARKLWDSDLAQTLCGSPLYMSPEIISRNEYSTKSDLWSLGIIIYEMVYDKNPYSDAINPMDLLRKIKTRKIKFSDDVCKECNELLSGLLQQQPEKRSDWDSLFNNTWTNEKKIVEDSPDNLFIMDNLNNLNKLENLENLNDSINFEIEDSNVILLKSHIDTPEELPLKSIIIDEYEKGIEIKAELATTPKAMKTREPWNGVYNNNKVPSSPKSLPSEYAQHFIKNLDYKNVINVMTNSVGGISDTVKGAVRGAVSYLSQ